MPWNWIAEHGFTFLQSAGIIGGLFFTAASFRTDAKERRLSNLHAVHAHHRELWGRLHDHPELARVLDPATDVEAEPVNVLEERFVLMLLFHLNAVRRAIEEGLYPAPEGLDEDVRLFLSLPVPSVVWERIRDSQDRAFVRFVEDIVSGRGTRG